MSIKNVSDMSAEEIQEMAGARLKFGAYQVDNIATVVVYGKTTTGLVDIDPAELDELIAKLQRVRASMAE